MRGTALNTIFGPGRALMWLTGVNVGVWVLMAVCAMAVRLGSLWGVEVPGWLVLPASFPAWAHRPWTLLTYMFTHADFFHIFFNMLLLLWFGRLLSLSRSAKSMVWTYIGGGLAGGVLYMCVSAVWPTVFTPAGILMGASAAVLAVLAAATVLNPNMPIHLFFIGDVPLKWMALAMAVLSFLGLGGGNAGGEVAHIGGLACGVIVGVCLARPRRAPRPRGPRFGTVISRDAADIIRQNRAEAARLDELLDKIHTSGYNSLTAEERRELDYLSKHVSR